MSSYDQVAKKQSLAACRGYWYGFVRSLSALSGDFVLVQPHRKFATNLFPAQRDFTRELRDVVHKSIDPIPDLDGKLPNHCWSSSAVLGECGVPLEPLCVQATKDLPVRILS